MSFWVLLSEKHQTRVQFESNSLIFSKTAARHMLVQAFAKAASPVGLRTNIHYSENFLKDQLNSVPREPAQPSNYLSSLTNSWLFCCHFHCNPILSQFPVITNSVNCHRFLTWCINICFSAFSIPSFLITFLSLYEPLYTTCSTDPTHNMDSHLTQKHLVTTVKCTTRFQV